ncbi:MAG: type VI secretion system baseplate subunit TssG [Pirellulales bacterium]
MSSRLDEQSDADRTPADSIREVGFFQFLRRLQIEHNRQTGSSSGGPALLGTDTPPASEPIFLGGDLDTAFPATEIARLIEPITSSGRSEFIREPASRESSTTTQPRRARPRLEASFFGMYGTMGALPMHYTDTLRERARNKDYAMREFFDLFNHRLLSFLYRVWEKYRLPAAHETAAACGREDAITTAIQALVGLRTQGQKGRLSIPDSLWIYHSGQSASARPDASSLAQILQEALHVRIEIEQFVGQWLTLTPDNQSRLGGLGSALGFNNALGVDSVAGSRVWDVENRFRVKLGPVDWESFQRYMPLETAMRRIADIIRRYVGPQLEFEVQVLLVASEVRGVQLQEETSPRLGWNTWLGTRSDPRPADEAMLNRQTHCRLITPHTRSFLHKHRVVIGSIMIQVDLKKLFDKLSPVCCRTLELATALCMTRTNYNVELEHWLFKLLENGGSDFTRVLQSFDLDLSHVQSDLTLAAR